MSYHHGRAYTALHLLRFPRKDVRHEITGVGVRRWKRPGEALGGGKLAGRAVVVFVTPQTNKAADGARPAAPETQLGPRLLLRARARMARFHSFHQPLHENPRLGIPQVPG